MGEVVEISQYQYRRREPVPSPASRRRERPSPAPRRRESLVPIELAVGNRDRAACISKIAAYGISAIQVRMIDEDPAALLYLMSVKDAILLNRQILEREDITDEELSRRIDLIQMLENIDPALMDSLWDSFTSSSASP